MTHAYSKKANTAKLTENICHNKSEHEISREKNNISHNKSEHKHYRHVHMSMGVCALKLDKERSLNVGWFS